MATANTLLMAGGKCTGTKWRTILPASDFKGFPRETPRIRNKYSPPPTRGDKQGGAQKHIIVGLVERGGNVRSFHVQQATSETVRDILVKNVSRKSTLHADESHIYTTLRTEFAAHNTINHRSQEYVKGTVHTNTIENVWSVFKRGMKGVRQDRCLVF
jgi:transposase-like protein